MMEQLILAKFSDVIREVQYQIHKLAPIVHWEPIFTDSFNKLREINWDSSENRILNFFDSHIKTRRLSNLFYFEKWNDLETKYPSVKNNEIQGYVDVLNDKPFYYINPLSPSIEADINQNISDSKIKLAELLSEINPKIQLKTECSAKVRSYRKEMQEAGIRLTKAACKGNVFEETKEYEVYQNLKQQIRSLEFQINNVDEQLKVLNRTKKEMENDILNTESKLQIVRSGFEEANEIIENYRDCFIREQDELKSGYEEALHYYNWGQPEHLCAYILRNSWYDFDFIREIYIEYSSAGNMILNYRLPSIDDIKCLDEDLSAPKIKKLYEEILYSITIRSVGEIFHFDEKNYIQSICFNGIVSVRNKCTGKLEDRTILSISVTKDQIDSLDLKYISPKDCFKYLKGVSATKLYESTPITPIQSLSFTDKRTVDAKNIETDSSVNLAEMDWEDFEHLVRQIFEWEFNSEGTEVHVTQASRDGGVDAIIFDPDPIHGGKIVIQAKRYTNTVSVSAVRDLYGTVINEGANKGILITTSDYGADSYKFAQGKPLTLLNGGHLLYLMNKHGRKARININEAKDKIIRK